MAISIIEDTRQQKGKHEIKHQYWHGLGVPIVRSALPFGDYALVPAVVVDTKKDIYEIANNLQQQHKRFRDECIKAHKADCQLIILIENTDGVSTLADLCNWRESDEHFYGRNGKRRIIGATIAGIMRTMTENYGVKFEFCTPNEAGRRVLEILGGGPDG